MTGDAASLILAAIGLVLMLFSLPALDPVLTDSKTAQRVGRGMLIAGALCLAPAVIRLWIAAVLA
jgi:hypothetical protein